MSKPSRGAKRRPDDGGESLEERPAQVARVSSPCSSDPPLVPLALSSTSTSNTNHVMEEILQKLERIKDGRETNTTVPKYLGLCLRTSARKGRVDIFLRLLQIEGMNENVNDADVKGITAMMYACQVGCQELVKIMLDNQKFDPTLRDQNNNGLLNFAVKNKNLDIVNLLLEDPRVSSIINSSNGDSPLLRAVAGGYQKLVVKLLENPKILVNKPNNNGDTPLMCAANEGFSNIVETLLERKDIEVNSANVDGVTSLMCASDKGYEKIVKSLLSHPDIDVNLQVR